MSTAAPEGGRAESAPASDLAGQVAGVRALAELPSLDTLRARLVGMISTPATRVAGVLQGSAGQLARVFGAFARKHEEGEVAAAA